MNRQKFAILVAIGLFHGLNADAESLPTPEVSILTKECYAAVGPTLQRADGVLTPDVRNAYLEWSEKTILRV